MRRLILAGAFLLLASSAQASPITFQTPCGCVWTLVPPQIAIDTEPDPPQTYQEWLADLAHEPPPPEPTWDVWCPPQEEGSVPEPGALVLIGLGGVGVWRRRRR